MSRIGVTLALLVLGANGARAQTITPATLKAEYLADMAEVESKLVQLAEAIHQDQYGWRPSEGVRSVSEALMHVTSENYYWMPMAVGAAPPADLGMGEGRDILANLEKVTDKAEIIRHLHSSYAYQKKVLDEAEAKLAAGKVMAFGQEQTVSRLYQIFTADQHEHLGQMIAYARSLGVVPPWSQSSGG